MKRILLAVLMVFLWVGIVCAASNVTFEGQDYRDIKSKAEILAEIPN